ncbi:MAG: hypothetical protein HWN67_13545 [Candidatus Helarchaeota archaeon]|nr:hypothetical protein [Candidatus Helarchaeota archaeon]
MTKNKSIGIIILISSIIVIGVAFFWYQNYNRNNDYSYYFLIPATIGGENGNEEEIEIPVIWLPIKYIDNVTGFGGWGTLIDFGPPIGWRPHEGIDLNLPNNTYIYAEHNGSISGIWIGDYGNQYQVEVEINADWKITHIFEPINNMSIPEMNNCVFVEINEEVTAGQVIGVLRGGGGHIHWDVLKRNRTADPIAYNRTNPSYYLSPDNYTLLNEKFHQLMIAPQPIDRIYDLLMFKDPMDWGVPELLNPFESLSNITSIRPFGVPNPKNESINESIHQDLDFNVSGQTKVLALYSGNCSAIIVNASNHQLIVDITLNPSFWIRFDLIINDDLNENELLNLLNGSINIGGDITQNQTILTIPSGGGILHMGLARYNHTTGKLNPSEYDWDNPSWFFNETVLTDIDNYYLTHDLENWQLAGFTHIY